MYEGNAEASSIDVSKFTVEEEEIIKFLVEKLSDEEFALLLTAYGLRASYPYPKPSGQARLEEWG